MAANTISPVSDNSIQLIDFLPRFDKHHSAYYFETSPVEEWSVFFCSYICRTSSSSTTLIMLIFIGNLDLP